MINEIGASALEAGQPTRQASGGKLGKDEFLKMLVAQMRNQDPLNPMQGEELAAQLAQFSSVEQLISLNQHMEAQSGSNDALLDALHRSSAVNLLGRNVLADGDLVNVAHGGATQVTVNVANAGGQAVLRIFDPSGQEVGSRELGNIPGGMQAIELGSAADGLPSGAYQYRLEVTGQDKQQVPVRTYTTGRVEGIQYGSNGAMLTVGGLLIPFGAVIEVLPAN